MQRCAAGSSQIKQIIIHHQTCRHRLCRSSGKSLNEQRRSDRSLQISLVSHDPPAFAMAAAWMSSIRQIQAWALYLRADVLQQEVFHNAWCSTSMKLQSWKFNLAIKEARALTDEIQRTYREDNIETTSMCPSPYNSLCCTTATRNKTPLPPQGKEHLNTTHAYKHYIHVWRYSVEIIRYSTGAVPTRQT